MFIQICLLLLLPCLSFSGVPRGGGEYGEDWHAAGTLDNKQNVFDDFMYAAKHLTEEGYTTKEQLAIMGGSNGGLVRLFCGNGGGGVRRSDQGPVTISFVSRVPDGFCFFYSRFYSGRCFRSHTAHPSSRHATRQTVSVRTSTCRALGWGSRANGTSTGTLTVQNTFVTCDGV